MALDLSKKTLLKEWYFIENDVQYGPFQLSELLDKINRDSLVWCDGIDWMIAEDVPDLQKYFPKIENSLPINVHQIQDYTDEANNPMFIPPQKMFSKPFSFEGRIRRAEYGISLIIFVFAHGISMNLAESAPVFVLALIPIYWFLWAQGAKRCHDKSNSGWYQIIPFYVLWMLFAEGDNYENEYGNSPK
jgi:hypothetical protein